MMHAKIGTREILKSDNYIFEPKLDGYRALCEINDGSIKFISRNGRDITHDFSDIKFSTTKNCILDGEIVSYDEKGNPSFSLMQRKAGVANYVIFDILEVEGISVKMLPIIQRKELLRVIVQENKLVQLIPYFTDGLELWDVMVSRSMEGVVAKKIESKYANGKTNSWVKIKNELTVDCIILGYVTKVREIASLALGLYKNGKIVYVGQVGTGFSEQFIQYLKILFQPILENNKDSDKRTKDKKDDKSDNKKDKVKRHKDNKDENNTDEYMKGEEVDLPKGVQRIEPKYVCEVKYIELTRDEKLRASVFIRLREDKYPQECTIDQVRLDA